MASGVEKELQNAAQVWRKGHTAESLGRSRRQNDRGRNTIDRDRVVASVAMIAASLALFLNV